MAIKGSSENQVQQLNDIVSSLESVNKSITNVYMVQRQLLSEISASNARGEKTSTAIKDTMERQASAMSNYMSSLGSAPVRTVGDSQVSATMKLMSASSIKPNEAANAEVSKVMEIVKDHTKQLTEAAKKPDQNNEAISKLISGIEKLTLNSGSMEKLAEDLKSGKIDGAKTFIKRTGIELDLDSRKKISPQLSRLVADARTINASDTDEIDKKEADEDSNKAILEIKNILQNKFSNSGTGTVADIKTQKKDIDPVKSAEENTNKIIGAIGGIAKGLAIPLKQMALMTAAILAIKAFIVFTNTKRKIEKAQVMVDDARKNGKDDEKYIHETFGDPKSDFYDPEIEKLMMDRQKKEIKPHVDSMKTAGAEAKTAVQKNMTDKNGKVIVGGYDERGKAITWERPNDNSSNQTSDMQRVWGGAFGKAVPYAGGSILLGTLAIGGKPGVLALGKFAFHPVTIAITGMIVELGSMIAMHKRLTEQSKNRIKQVMELWDNLQTFKNKILKTAIGTSFYAIMARSAYAISDEAYKVMRNLSDIVNKYLPRGDDIVDLADCIVSISHHIAKNILKDGFFTELDYSKSIDAVLQLTEKYRERLRQIINPKSQMMVDLFNIIVKNTTSEIEHTNAITFGSMGSDQLGMANHLAKTYGATTKPAQRMAKEAYESSRKLIGNDDQSTTGDTLPGIADNRNFIIKTDDGSIFRLQGNGDIFRYVGKEDFETGKSNQKNWSRIARNDQEIQKHIMMNGGSKEDVLRSYSSITSDGKRDYGIMQTDFNARTDATYLTLLNKLTSAVDGMYGGNNITNIGYNLPNSGSLPNENMGPIGRLGW